MTCLKCSQQCLIVVILFFLSSSMTPHKVDVGILLMTENFLPFDMPRIAPAIDMGIRDAKDIFNIEFNSILSNYSTSCDGSRTESIGKMSELYYQQNVKVFLGPACSQGVSSSGLFAEYHGLPLVTGVGDLLERSAREMKGYDTTTVVSYSIDKMSVSMKQILQQYGWYHTAILYDEDEVFFRRVGVNLAEDFRTDSDLARPYERGFPKATSDYKGILTQASAHARVFILLVQAKHFREVMYQAYQLGMAGGEYVFITIELFPSKWWGRYREFNGDRYVGDEYKNFAVTEAYKSVLIVSLMLQEGLKYREFKQELEERALRDYGYTFPAGETDNYFIRAFYDSVIYLALSYNRTIEEGGDINDGYRIARKLWNNSFEVPALDEIVAVDQFGDRIADFDVFDLRDPTTTPPTFGIVGKFYGSTLKYSPRPDIEILWVEGIPADIPECGFSGELCMKKVDEKTIIIATSSTVFITVICIAVAIVYFFYSRSLALYEMKWKVSWEDIQFSSSITASSGFSRSLMSSQSRISNNLEGSSGTQKNLQIFARVGYCHGVLVAVRRFDVPTLDLSKDNLLELKQLYSLRHANVALFMGACIDIGKMSVLMEYCPRGSLQDVLENDSIDLDWTFKFSLIEDIIMGMTYLHGNDVKVHGRLRSSSCVVDGRFLLKIRCYGPKCFYQAEHKRHLMKDKQNFNKLLWTAPELLRQSGWSPGTQHGDVYSFGIILHEIAERMYPFETYNLTAHEIVKKVRIRESPPFRPELSDNCRHELNEMIAECWVEQPEERPNFEVILRKFKTIFKGKSNNIMDNLIRRMEQYANNLESIVEERTKAYMDEKKRAENLLYRMIPRSVAEKLEHGTVVDPETFESVSVYFSDVVGFTKLAARSSPLEVVAFLNDLYTCFDAVIDDFRVYKVETIGDAYMVVSGLPEHIGIHHAKEIIDMAIALREQVRSFSIRHLPCEKLKIRIGVHSGTVVAGVVGLTMPRYCLFGDTVNTASRMESSGEAMKIHISHSTKTILDKFANYSIVERGEIEIKGKGKMRTFWLDKLSQEEAEDAHFWDLKLK